MGKKEKILILGGTTEAAERAATLARNGHEIVTSLAGRTSEPRPVAGELRIGGFGGAEGLAEYLKCEGFDRLIDATHPFARQISKNADIAAKRAGLPLDTVTRPPWEKRPGDRWIEVDTLAAARDAIPEGARVLLALGSQHIAGFAIRRDVHFLVRMIDPPSSPLPLADYELAIARPGETTEAETALLKAHAISHIVCRNSGGPAYAKIEAARDLNLPVIMVSRP